MNKLCICASYETLKSILQNIRQCNHWHSDISIFNCHSNCTFTANYCNNVTAANSLVCLTGNKQVLDMQLYFWRRKIPQSFVLGNLFHSCTGYKYALLHSERPKLHTILVILSATGLIQVGHMSNQKYLFQNSYKWKDQQMAR